MCNAETEKEHVTLGFHRAMAGVVFGEDSPAVKFLDKKIAECPNGENEKVLVSEGQIVMFLMSLHNKGDEADLDLNITVDLSELEDGTK